MRSIRKIAFVNAAGDRFGLNGEQGVFAMNLSGFGFAMSPTFADLKSGFFVPVSDEGDPQGATAFTLVFTREAYKTYQRLVNWLNASGRIAIAYNPTGTQEYRRDVSINFLQKGELNKARWLEVPCSLYSCTPWYCPSPASLILGAHTGSRGKRYDYRYTKNLRYGGASAFFRTGRIEGAGHIPGALELTYRGAVINPRIQLTGIRTGRNYGVCSVAAVFLQSDTLEYSSRYENSYVKRISADGTETDLLDALDLSAEPFFHIPVDEPCTVSVSSDAGLSGSADLQVYHYFRSV